MLDRYQDRTIENVNASDINSNINTPGHLTHTPVNLSSQTNLRPNQKRTNSKRVFRNSKFHFSAKGVTNHFPIDSLDTEENIDYKAVPKVPLDLVVHPKSNKWVFRKEEEMRTHTRNLKMRFNRNRSPEKTF